MCLENEPYNFHKLVCVSERVARVSTREVISLTRCRSILNTLIQKVIPEKTKIARKYGMKISNGRKN